MGFAMTSDKLIAKLDQLGQDVENAHPSINCGGCCVYAALVAKHLRSLGFEVWGIVAATESCHRQNATLDEARANVSNAHNADEWTSNGIHFNHVGVGFMLDGKEWQYDTSGAVMARRWLNSSEWRRYDGRLTVEELEALAGHAPNWNHCFRRSQIPAIAKRVANAFKPGRDRSGKAKRQELADERLMQELMS